MRKTWLKRNVAWFLSFIMLMVALPTGVWAEEIPSVSSTITEDTQLLNDDVEKETSSEVTEITEETGTSKEIAEETNDTEEVTITEEKDTSEETQEGEETEKQGEVEGTEEVVAEEKDTSEETVEQDDIVNKENTEISEEALISTAIMPEETDTIEVYVTISLEGELQLSKDRMTGMVCVPVELPKEATAFDALVEAHKLHHEDGEGGYSANDSNYFSKFWGKESYNIGYFTNGRMVLGPQDSLSDGDYLEGTVYKDWTSDIYARFDKQTVEIPAGQALSLTLLSNVITTADWKGGMMNGDVADIPLEGATLLTSDVVSCNIPYVKHENWVTNAEGKVTVSFEEPGIYYVSATKEGKNLIPPICKVKVTAPLSDEEKADIVSKDTNSLTFESIKGENHVLGEIETDLMLPTTGVSGKTTISWSSNDESALKNDGKVIRPIGENKKVKITANIAYGDVSETKNFDVTVKGYTVDEVEGTLSDVIAMLPSRITPKEWEGDTKKDNNIIYLLQEEVAKINSSIAVSEDCNPGEQTQIAINGDITYGSSRVRNKDVIFTLSLGKVSKEYTASVTVNAKASTKEEALSGDWLTFEVIQKMNESEDKIVSDLGLPKEDDKRYYTEIEWTSSNEDIISIGDYAINGIYTAKVRRPKLGEQDAAVTLTAKIKPGLYWDYGMSPEGPMPTPAYGEKTFQLIVPAVTESEQTAALNFVNEGIELFNLDHLVDRGIREQIDLQALEYSFNGVPYNWNYVDDLENFKEEYRVIDVKWTSENSGIGEISTGAEVTRTSTEQTGDIVLTLSYNGAIVEKRFPTKVKAFTDMDVSKENDILKSVADVLTFDVIKDKNINSDNVTGDFIKVVGAIKGDSGTSFEKFKKYHHVGANIDWLSSNTEVINEDLEVARPEKTTQVTLTAILTSPKFHNCPGVESVEKTFHVTVLGADEQPQENRKQIQINEMMNNIATGYIDKDTTWWGNSATWWHAIGINAYQNITEDTKKDISKEAKQAFVNKSISEITGLGEIASSNANKLANTINGMSAFGYDSSLLWTVDKSKMDAVAQLKNIKMDDAKKGWYATIAPYVLLAFNQGEYHSDAQENNHIEYLLDELKNVNWSFGVDTPAMILQGLAPYYDRQVVKSEIDKMLLTLSEKQSENGSYGSANSDASVIIALAELGINPDSDPRFIKDGKSLIDGLLSYQLSTKDGFWYSKENIYNEFATQQGFLALIAARQVIVTGKPYNVFDFSMTPKSPAYAKQSESESPNTSEPTEPDSKQNIKVEFTLNSMRGTWITKTTFTAKSDATVYDVFTKILDEKGFRYDGADSNYVSSITNPSGTTLAQFSKGKNSGWMYKVNGELPKEGLKDYSLSDGDSIVWYYTGDWTKDSDAVESVGDGSVIEEKLEEEENITEKVKIEASTDANGKATVLVPTQNIQNSIKAVIKDDTANKEVKVVIQTDRKATEIETKLLRESIAELSEKVDAVTIQTAFADIRLDKKNLENFERNFNGDVKLTIQKLDFNKNKTIPLDKKSNMDSLIGDRPVFDFNLSIGNKKISEFVENVEISLPYLSSENENENGLVTYYINNENNLELMQDCIYDSSSKMMNFTTNHFSMYAIGYRNLNFKDISQHWAKDEIIYLAARDIVVGVDNSCFAPDSQVTRAEFIQILANLSKEEVEMTSNSMFADVPKDAWYASAIAWADKREIIAGFNSNDGTKIFHPDDCITRQDMAVILSRYMSEVEKKKLSQEKTEIVFNDAEDIESYAKSAVLELQKAGIINGKTKKCFAPREFATRAECSKMITSLMQD